MHITFQGMQIFVTLLLLIEFPAAAHASEPITVVYGRGRAQRPRQDALARAYCDRAWVRLNCPDQAYRNGQQALKDATSACKLIDWKDENMIDTLAMAYAEIGDFDSAVRYEEKALVIKGVKADDSKRLQAHFDSFKQHRPLQGL
jgi:tetratricopeptide (TPR) repeat protein